MKRALLWACLMLPILQWVKEPIFVWVGFSLLSMGILKKNAWIAILVSALTFIPISMEDLFFELSVPRIVELNDNSVIVAMPGGKILVRVEDVNLYHLLDQVEILSFEPFQITPTTSGFDQLSYQVANGLIGQTGEDRMSVIRHQPIMVFLDSGGFNRDPRFQTLVRAVLFQSDQGSQFITLISMGLIYTMILKSGKTMLSVFMDENLATSLMCVLLIIGSVFFAYPLSLLRVIMTALCRLVFKNGKTRIIVTVLFFQMLNPRALTSLAILYPLALTILANFKVARFDRWVGLSAFQIVLMNRIALLRVILYPVLRIMMAIMIGLLWLAYGLTFLNPVVFVSHDILTRIIQGFERFLVIRGSLTIPVLSMGLALVALRLIEIPRPVFRALSIIGLLGIPLLSAPWAYQVTFISVGQGDAILLQAPFNKETILIDTGKPSAVGQVRSILDAQGIGTLTTMILTHDDNDHSGNSIVLQKDYRIQEIVVTPKDLDTRWFHLKSLKTTLANPTDNQASLVTYMKLNQIRFLFMADADEMTEIDLIRQYPDLKADILKVGHHGSATSTSDALLSTLQAKLGIISVGYNAYGHPSSSTLHRLRDFKVKVLLTRNEGDITVILTPFGNFIRFSTMKAKPLGSLFDIIDPDKP